MPEYINQNTDQAKLYEVIRNQRAQIIRLQEEIRLLKESFHTE